MWLTFNNIISKLSSEQLDVIKSIEKHLDYIITTDKNYHEGFETISHNLPIKIQNYAITYTINDFLSVVFSEGETDYYGKIFPRNYTQHFMFSTHTVNKENISLEFCFKKEYNRYKIEKINFIKNMIVSFYEKDELRPFLSINILDEENYKALKRDHLFLFLTYCFNQSSFDLKDMKDSFYLETDIDVQSEINDFEEIFKLMNEIKGFIC